MKEDKNFEFIDGKWQRVEPYYFNGRWIPADEINKSRDEREREAKEDRDRYWQEYKDAGGKYVPSFASEVVPYTKFPPMGQSKSRSGSGYTYRPIVRPAAKYGAPSGPRSGPTGPITGTKYLFGSRGPTSGPRSGPISTRSKPRTFNDVRGLGAGGARGYSSDNRPFLGDASSFFAHSGRPPMDHFRPQSLSNPEVSTNRILTTDESDFVIKGDTGTMMSRLKSGYLNPERYKYSGFKRPMGTSGRY